MGVMDIVRRAWSRMWQTPAGADVVSPAPYWTRLALSLFVLGMGVYTALATAAIVHRTYSPVMFWDQWEYVDMLLHSGYFPPLSRIWAQYNEHRFVVGRLSGLIDIRLFGGRNVSLLVELYLIQVGLATLFIWMMRRFAQIRGVVLATGAGFVIFCAFCSEQIDNFASGNQVGFVLAGFAAAIAFAGAILHAAGGSRRWASWPLALSLIAAFVAECSLADGVLVWPILVIIGFSLRYSKKTFALIGGIGAAAIVAYFWHYRSPPNEAGPLESIRHPVAVAKYVVTYFANTWDSEFGSPFSGWPTVSESFIILAIAIALVGIVRYLLLRRSSSSPLAVFLAANMLFTLSAATISALGRISFGVVQAETSRYQTIALVFWASLATLMLVWVADRHTAALPALQIGLLVLMMASARRSHSYEDMIAARQVRIDRAYIAVTRDPSNQEAAKALHPWVQMVPVWVAYLRQHNLGPDVGQLQDQLSRSSRPAPVPNWAGYNVVPQANCTGWIDDFGPGPPEGISLRGWAWDRQGRRPPARIVFALPNGNVVGFGQFTIAREDVSAAVKEVTNINIGWEGDAFPPHGSKLRGFALLNDGTSICPLPNDVTVP